MAKRIARIICMGRLGGYTALLGGALLEVDRRMLWSSAEALMADARRIGVEISNLTIDTRTFIGEPAASYPVPLRRAA